MKVKINRERWARGKTGKCKLLQADGKMCCLGFVSLAEGYSEDEILNRAMPMSLPLGSECMKKLCSHNGRLAWAASGANDNIEITEAVRERQVAEILAEAGYEVEFE